jgi:hypothetical protein
VPAPPALLNRVPFGCSSGVGPEDRTGVCLWATKSKQGFIFCREKPAQN